jgi:hypothetical protein
MPTDVITVKKRAFFRDLAKKKMSDVHSKLMRSLIEEHACGRKTVNGSESAERACIIDETESSQNIKVVEGVGRVFSHAH